MLSWHMCMNMLMEYAKICSHTASFWEIVSVTAHHNLRYHSHKRSNIQAFLRPTHASSHPKLQPFLTLPFHLLAAGLLWKVSGIVFVLYSSQIFSWLCFLSGCGPHKTYSSPVLDRLILHGHHIFCLLASCISLTFLFRVGKEQNKNTCKNNTKNHLGCKV